MERSSVDSDPLGALLGSADEEDDSLSKKKANQRKLEEANRWKGLSFEQEMYLKKLLIKHSIDREVQAFAAAPNITTVDNTIFVKYMYYNCILGFPLFRNLKQSKPSSSSSSSSSSSATTTAATSAPSPAVTTPTAIPTPGTAGVDENEEVVISGDVKEDAAFLDSLQCSDLKPQLDKLFFLYPKLQRLQKKALKGEAPGRVGPLVDILDLLINTQLEEKTSAKVKRILEEENNRKVSDPVPPTSLSEKDHEEVDRAMHHMSVRRETLLLLQILLGEVSRKGSASPFYDTLLRSKSMADLPILYRKLIGLVHVTPMIHFFFGVPEKTAMMRGIHNTMPKGTLKALFTIANPLRILANLLKLFLMRPLGKKNLLQRFLDVGTAISKTDDELTAARGRINNKDVCTKIQAWVEANYKAAEDEAEEDQKNVTAEHKAKLVNKVLCAEPNNMQQLAQQLNKQQIAAIYDIIRLEMRRKEKQEYIDFFGSDQFIEPLQAVAATVTVPIIELTSKIDMPALLSSYFKLMEGFLATAESNASDDEKLKKYEEGLAKFENSMLPAIQQLVNADQQNHVLETLLLWTTQFFGGSTNVVIDFKKLLDENLDDEDKFIVMAEVDAWIHYKKKDREYKDNFQKTPLQPPSQNHIPKLLCDPFLKAVRPYFEDKIRKSQ